MPSRSGMMIKAGAAGVHMKIKYFRLVSRGKSPSVAATAVALELLEIVCANALSDRGKKRQSEAIASRGERMNPLSVPKGETQGARPGTSSLAMWRTKTYRKPRSNQVVIVIVPV